MENMYSIKQAAEILDVSKSTIRRRIKSGKLNAEKKEGPYGNQYFISEKELDQAVAENEIVEVGQINKPINAEQFINDLKTAIKERDEDLMDKVAQQLEEQQDAIKKDNEALMEEYKNQQELNKKLVDEIKELKEIQKRTIFDKIKDIFT